MANYKDDIDYMLKMIENIEKKMYDHKDPIMCPDLIISRKWVEESFVEIKVIKNDLKLILDELKHNKKYQ